MVVSDGVKEPEPKDDHWPVEVVPTMFPLRITLVFAQEVASCPASTDGTVVQVIIMVSLTALQFPLLVEVKTRATFPARLSLVL